MNEIKTLADQLRSKMGKPDTPANDETAEKKKAAKPPQTPAIVEQLRTLNVTKNKTLIHARVDSQTAQLIHHLKTATGIEVTRLISFSIRHFFEAYPELKAIIKEHLSNFEL